MSELTLSQLKEFTSPEKIKALFKQIRDFLPRGYAATVVKRIKEKSPESKISTYNVRNIVYGTCEVDEYNVFGEVIDLAIPHIRNKIERAEKILEVTNMLDKVAVLRALDAGDRVVISPSKVAC